MKGVLAINSKNSQDTYIQPSVTECKMFTSRSSNKELLLYSLGGRVCLTNLQLALFVLIREHHRLAVEHRILSIEYWRDC